MGLFSSSKSHRQENADATESSADNKQKDNSENNNKGKEKVVEQKPRAIYLLVWPSALFKAHWAIFIPDADDKTVKIGRYIHATGSLDKGFQIEFVRGYDISKTRNRPQSPIEIGWVQADLLQDTPTNGQLVKESQYRDRFEQHVAAVPTPPPSLRSTNDDAAGKGKRKNVELSDCQYWIKKVVEELEAEGILTEPLKGLNKGKKPSDIIMSAPRH